MNPHASQKCSPDFVLSIAFSTSPRKPTITRCKQTFRSSSSHHLRSTRAVYKSWLGENWRDGPHESRYKCSFRVHTVNIRVVIHIVRVRTLQHSSHSLTFEKSKTCLKELCNAVTLSRISLARRCRAKIRSRAFQILCICQRTKMMSIFLHTCEVRSPIALNCRSDSFQKRW